MDISEAIKELRDSWELHQCEWAKRCLDTIESELEKKDKIIDKMAEHIEKGCDFDNRMQTKRQIIEYFTKLAEEEK